MLKAFKYLAVPVRLFLKSRPGQLSCLLFGFLDSVTYSLRVILLVDHTFVEKPM